jgi:hypothetical protein
MVLTSSCDLNSALLAAAREPRPEGSAARVLRVAAVSGLQTPAGEPETVRALGERISDSLSQQSDF